MPPEPLPWDRKELLRDRRHTHDFGGGGGSGGPPSSRWRDSSSSSSYGGSRNNSNNNNNNNNNNNSNNSHHHHHEFSPRWGFPSSDFRRPPGHGKQGGWHMYPEDHGYSTPRSDRFMDDDIFRPSGMRGDGRYGRFYRENRPSFGQKECRGHSWEPNHNHSGPANGIGRPHIVNDPRTIDESPMRASHPHSDPRDQSHLNEQSDKTSDANGSGMGLKVDKENTLGSLDWKPLKWSRSGSLTSRGSGFSHSSSSKSMGGESSGDVKGDLPPKTVALIQSPSGDAVACVPSVAPPEEASSRKKPRLGWGEGLAKYEKKKVDPEDNVNKAGNVNSVNNAEPSHSLPSNLVEKSPKVTGFSDCSSPATPSSFACSSSPGMEDRTYGKTVDAGGDASNFSVSSMPVPESQLEGSHFRLEKLELKSITNLGSLLNELLLADDQCSMDSGFMRSSAFNKLLLWKGEISKTLELTETEIDLLENELSLLKSDTVQSFHCPASSNSGPTDYKGGQSDGQTFFLRPRPLEVVSNGDLILEDRHPCDDARGVQTESKDEDIDSPGTATSKFVEPPVQKAVSLDVCKKSSYGETGFVESTKSTKDVGTSCQGHDRRVGQVNIIAIGIEPPGVCDNKEDKICESILASNKEFANRAAEGLLKLLPSCDHSIVANKVSCMPADSTVKEKFLRRRRSLRFKERVISLKFRAFHHLWKEDLRLLSLRSHRTKPHKKLDPSSRTMQIGSQKHRSSIRSRFTSPAGSLSLVPTTEIINFTGKLLSDSQPKLYRRDLKMPAMILDEKEKMSRFVSSNGLVEDPCAVEKERSLINPWTCEEKEVFMDKLAIYGKDFRKIASFIDHKTTADCIEFYYKNHKSECFEKIKKLEVKKQGKPLSSNTYMVTSGKKWSSREMNAASLDILGAASVIAAQADQALETSKLLSVKSSNRKSRGSVSIIEASSSFYGAEDERETAAADVLAGICGSLSSEAMSSCITSSVDPGEGNQDWKHQKVGSSIRQPLTPEVTQNVDDNTCSDESCGEMDPTDWTDDEKSLFVQAFSSHGKDFLMISRCVRTKSRDQCKVFFSKARKCLGLDALPTVSGSGGIHASNDTNGGGSDTEDAGIETGSVVCSDKSGSRIDEDLLHVNQDVSKPEVTVAELNMLEENCGPGQLDHKDSGLELEDLLPHGRLADVSDPIACSGVVDVLVRDSATAIDNQRSEVHPIIKDNNMKLNAEVSTSAAEIVPVDSGVAMDMEAASGTSDRISEVHVSSAPIKFASPGDGLCKPSTNGDNVHNLQSGSSMVNQSEFRHDKKGFPLDLSIKADLHDVVTHTVGAESIVDRSFQHSFLRKCSRNVSHNSVAEFPLPQSEDELGSSCSSKTEKPCRNGNVKLFGKILSKPSSADKPSNVVHDEKVKHHSSPGGKFDMKLTANQDLKGNSMCFAEDHTSFLGLENVPIRSYGFWDGTKIQTGFSTLPDSALLLAKYPGAFSNYSISSPKSEQQPLQAAAVNGNECNMNGACVFSPREFSSSNGGNVMDYTVLRNQEELQPFTLDMKQRPQEVVFPEVQRNGFETLQPQGKGLVKLNVVQGGDILGSSCTGISDPVAALKLHYASQQFGGGGGGGGGYAVNGIVREEPWRSQGGGDVGR